MKSNLARILQPLLLLSIVALFYLLWRESFITAKVIHLLALISWFAGLFYLPRLFVYHAMATEPTVDETLKTMEYKLFHYIMNPAAALTLLAGVWMIDLWQWRIPPWLQLKLVLVALLLYYHWLCLGHLRRFQQGDNPHNHRYFRFFNEAPTLLLIAIVILVVAKPF